MHIFEFIAVAQIQRGQNLFEVAIAFLKTCDYTRVLKYRSRALKSRGS